MGMKSAFLNLTLMLTVSLSAFAGYREDYSNFEKKFEKKFAESEISNILNLASDAKKIEFITHLLNSTQSMPEFSAVDFVLKRRFNFDRNYVRRTVLAKALVASDDHLLELAKKGLQEYPGDAAEWIFREISSAANLSSLRLKRITS